jgi:tRNA(Arg) A34 adenosine deaminase TadA
MVAVDELDQETYIRRAFELARGAVERGDRPFGSVLVHDGEVVYEDSNHTATEDDITYHPEITAARWAAQHCDDDEQSELVLFTSTAPCPMCSGSLLRTNLGAVVYSVSREHYADITGGPVGVPSEEILERGGSDIEYVGPVLPDEGGDIIREHLV